MRVDKQFNKRGTELVEVQEPCVYAEQGNALGLKVTLFPIPGDDRGRMNIHMTPLDALNFAKNLVAQAHCVLSRD